MAWAFEDGLSAARGPERLAVGHDIDDAGEHDDYRLEFTRRLERLAGLEVGQGESDEVTFALGRDDCSGHDNPFECLGPRLGRIGGLHSPTSGRETRKARLSGRRCGSPAESD